MQIPKILPIAMDANFIRLGVIDDYISLIWSIRYYDHGDFEIKTGVSAKVAQLLSVGNYILREDDDNVGIVEKVDVTITETNEQYFTASGRFLTQILGRRIIAQQTQVRGTVASAINKLITDAIISPEISARQISNFILGDYTTSATMSAQFTGKNLYEVISETCQQYGIGFKITLNHANQFVFSLYEGVDRSYNQSVNPYVVFSNEYENLINAEYQKDAQNLITAVLAAGEGEGLDRKTVWVTSQANPTGLNRYEYYDDSRNVSSNEGEISEQEYLAQLAELGRENLTTYETTFAGQIDLTTVQFKTDVNIGDIVSIENTDVGLSFNARIIELIESVDENGKYTIIPTFGT